MSRVVRLHRFGGLEVVQIENLPYRELKECKLRGRVEVIGLNRPEKMFRSESYLEQPTLSAQNGYEASAVVPISSLGKRPITWSRKPTTERSSSPCDPTPDAQSFPQRSVNYIQ
mgnify:CR=1 FL=1